MPFKAGKPRAAKAGRRKGTPNKATLAPDVKAIAQTYTARALEVLAQVMNDEKAPPQARTSAADKLLDRGWGKPAQSLTGEGGKPLFPAKLIVELHPGVAPPARVSA